MELNYLAFAVPAFLFFCTWEYYVAAKTSKQVFNFSETISNLNVGIFERSCDLFTTALLHFYFVWLYNNFAIFNIPSNALIWIALFLATDLLWYCYHRLGHRVNILWAAHVVHHQSEDFNFTVSARITIFQSFARALFWSFIPLLGFSPAMMTTILLIHGAYPFFLHTQLVGKLGLLEKVIVTPSHHRVHHSSNEKYLDKNFGDVLIIWDKLFGTFVEEDEQEKPVYGITTPLNSYSFLWQHFHFAAEIALAFVRAKGWKAKFLTIFGTPENIDPNIRHELESKLLVQKTKTPLSQTLIRFVATNTAIILLFEFVFLLFGHYQTWYHLLAGCLFVLISVIHIGAVLEQRQWLFHLEFIRISLLTLYLILLFPNNRLAITGILLLSTLVLFYETMNKKYLQLLTIRH